MILQRRHYFYVVGYATKILEIARICLTLYSVGHVARLFNKGMKKSEIVIIVLLALLFVGLSWFYVDVLVRSGSEINLRTLLPVPISGIIIFVPLYKKYIKNK